ncbi:MAG: phasin family protein [Pseudomonadota bacterium]|nr:phasin family protein [Pseudomonadota bacterium]
MINDLFIRSLEQFQVVLTPAAKTHQLLATYLEKLVTYQTAALRSYMDLGVSRLKAATEITDYQGLQDFYAGQVQLVGVLRHKLVDDAKALTDLGISFKVEMDRLIRESLIQWVRTTRISRPVPARAAA